MEGEPIMFIEPASSEEFRVAVGKIFERQRKHLKLAQWELATAVGLRQRDTIYLYESGEVTPSLPVFLRLVKVLKIDMAEMMYCMRYDYRPYKKDRRLERVWRLAAGPKHPSTQKELT